MAALRQSEQQQQQRAMLCLSARCDVLQAHLLPSDAVLGGYMPDWTLPTAKIDFQYASGAEHVWNLLPQLRSLICKCMRGLHTLRAVMKDHISCPS